MKKRLADSFDLQDVVRCRDPSEASLTLLSALRPLSPSPLPASEYRQPRTLPEPPPPCQDLFAQKTRDGNRQLSRTVRGRLTVQTPRQGKRPHVCLASPTIAAALLRVGCGWLARRARTTLADFHPVQRAEGRARKHAAQLRVTTQHIRRPRRLSSLDHVRLRQFSPPEDHQPSVALIPELASVRALERRHPSIE